MRRSGGRRDTAWRARRDEGGPTPRCAGRPAASRWAIWATASSRAFSDLLAALLSAKGYAKVRDVMLGDDLRATVDGERNEGVGIEAFRFAVFGDPSATSRWAVQLDGHHVALNVTLDGEAYSMSPSFIGTYPQAFAVAGAKIAAAGGGDRSRAPAGRQPDAGAARAGGDRREARRPAGRAPLGRRRAGARRHPRQAAERGAEGGAPGARLAVVRSHAAGACAGAQGAVSRRAGRTQPGSPGAARWRPGATFPGRYRGRRSSSSMPTTRGAAPTPAIPWITSTRSTGTWTATMAAGERSVPATRRRAE